MMSVYLIVIFCLCLFTISFMSWFNFYYGNTLSHTPVNVGRSDDVIPHLEWRKDVRKRLNRKSPFRKYLILFYTEYFHTRPWKRHYTRKEKKNACGKQVKCEFTYDKDRFVESHAVIFHGSDMSKVEELEMLSRHPVRKKQVWVYFTLENPVFINFPTELNPFFNVSMSYRLDSDIHFPYRQHVKRNPTSLVHKRTSTVNYAENKTKQVAWLVSHCGELRDTFVQKLEDLGLEIDVGGKCGAYKDNELECKLEDCSKTLQKYKFYLALENYFCKDYVTEKYWYHAIDNNMIPIVLGGADYTNPLLAIPGSYINPFDFKNPRDLVDHIQEVDANNELFNSYFKWKPYWRFKPGNFECNMALHRLCDMLKSPLKRKKRKKEMSEEFGESRECHQKAFLFKMWLVK